MDETFAGAPVRFYLRISAMVPNIESGILLYKHVRN